MNHEACDHRKHSHYKGDRSLHLVYFFHLVLQEPKRLFGPACHDGCEVRHYEPMIFVETEVAQKGQGLPLVGNQRQLFKVVTCFSRDVVDSLEIFPFLT